MRFQPVAAPSAVGLERDAEVGSLLHLPDDKLLYPILFLREDAEVEFIMNLENHLALQTLSLHACCHPYHGNLDDVRCRSLYGRVDGIAFRIATHDGVVRVDVGQVTAAAEERFRIALVACLLYALVHVTLHAGIALEVSVYELLCLAAAYSHALRQSEG